MMDLRDSQPFTASVVIGLLFMVICSPVETHAQDPVQTWRLEDTFSVRKIARGADGRLYVPDRDQHQVFIYDADGNRVRAVGREGKGPSEFQQPLSIALSPDEETFAVCDFNRRVSLFSREGVFKQSFMLPGVLPFASDMTFISDSLLVIGGLKPVSIYEGDMLHVYRTSGNPVVSFYGRTDQARALKVTVEVGAGFDVYRERIYAIQSVDYTISEFTLNGREKQQVEVAPFPEHLVLPSDPQPHPRENREAVVQWTGNHDFLRRLFVVSEDILVVTVDKSDVDHRYMDFIDRRTGRVVHSRPFNGWVVDADPERAWVYVAEPQDEPVTLLRAYRVDDLLEGE